ncbi:hypothetical protein [Melittangium boletus]|uniref:Chemotaxis response regulator protein-glutamate methylesterase n=1 Tax=Melittangium boletus DSM 14713 TaxID=1294270 RepID=A0A250IGK7_9BACT|nr:hypothetical protein [Melittangium boletus]ATB30398.1 chemotaxis response regulator protein-glutamate methylesterase [Melittangium boletus DSM 14713]
MRALPAPFPVVVAQHIVHGFEPGFAQSAGMGTLVAALARQAAKG